MGRRQRQALLHVVTSLLALVLLVAGCSSGGSSREGSASSGPGGSSSSASPTDGASTSSTPTPPPPQPRAGLAAVGQCYQMSARQARAAVPTGRRVRCRAPHTTVVAYAGLSRAPITSRTPLAQRRAVAARVCRPAFARVAGGSPEDRATSVLTWVFFTPSAAQLAKGARWVRCDVLARSGDVLVPLIPTTPLLRGGIPEVLRVCQTAAGTDVSCSKPHALRVEAVYRESRAAYPAPAGYTQVARDRCEQLMDGYGGYWQPPGRAGWAAGDRFVRCLRQD